MMIEYYTFDMSALREEVERILSNESEKISKEKEDKLKEISNNFKRIMRLAQDHVAKGSGYKVNSLDEQKTILEFEKQSEEFEKIVRDANMNKGQLRTEIAALESELRRLRDQVADKQIENKNLAYLIEKEKDLKKQKTDLEEKALRTLSSDLEDQLNEM